MMHCVLLRYCCEDLLIQCFTVCITMERNSGICFLLKAPVYLISQKATALAAATLSESTPAAMGIFTV